MSVVLVDSGGSNLGSVQAAFGRLGVEAPVTGDPARIRAATHVVLPGVGAAAVAMARLREQALVELIRELRQPVLGVCVGMQILFEHSEEGDTACLGVIPGRVRKLTGRPGLRVPHMGWNQLQWVTHPLPAGMSHTVDSKVLSGSRAQGSGPGAQQNQEPTRDGSERDRCALTSTRTQTGSELGPPIEPGAGSEPWALGAGVFQGSAKPQLDSHPLCAGLVGGYAYFVHSFAAPVTESSLLCVEHGQTFSALVSRGNYSGAQFHPERSAAIGARLLANFLATDGGQA